VIARDKLKTGHFWRLLHTTPYSHGDAFGHLCFKVDYVYQACERIEKQGGVVTRKPGPVEGGTTVITFIKDPNGYQIELI